MLQDQACCPGTRHMIDAGKVQLHIILSRILLRLPLFSRRITGSDTRVPRICCVSPNSVPDTIWPFLRAEN